MVEQALAHMPIVLQSLVEPFLLEDHPIVNAGGFSGGLFDSGADPLPDAGPALGRDAAAPDDREDEDDSGCRVGSNSTAGTSAGVWLLALLAWRQRWRRRH